MTLRLHEGAGNWFVVITQLLLLMLLSLSNIPYGFALGMTAAGALALLGWSAASRRARIVADTASSKIDTAAQGYVEVSGIAEPMPDEPLRDPASGIACVWYRVETHANQGGGWVIERTVRSRAPIRLRDETGVCLILPKGAELRLAGEQRVKENARREHRVQRILAGDRLYAIGWFETRAGGAARAEHFLRAPDDGRPFVLSDRPAKRLADQYREWAKAHAAVAFLGLFVAIALALTTL
jgi:hypothetical protein